MHRKHVFNTIMKRLQSTCRFVTILILANVALLATKVPAEPLPSQEELQKLFADGQYKPLIQQVNKILALDGESAKTCDKADAALLKTNALIMLKQPQQALVASNDAVKNLKPSTAPAKAAEIHALQVLLTAAPRGVYTPKAAGAKPLPLESTPREDLLKALLADRRAEDLAKAKNVRAVPVAMETINRVSQTRWVELAVTQADTDSQKTIDELAKTTSGLMDDIVAPLGVRVKTIRDNVHGFTVVEHDEKNHINWGYRTTKSLQPADARQLKSDVATCTQIIATCDDLAQRSTENADSFKRISRSAEEASSQASTLLKEFRVQ